MLAVEASALAAALTRAKVGRHHLPILTGVRLVATGGRLSCWRSDLTLTVEAFAPIGKGDLDVVVPADLLLQYASTVDGPLAIAIVKDRLVVEAARSNISLPMFNLDDWPLVEHAEGETIELTEADVAAIRTVAYAAGTDTQRPTLTGIHFTGERVEAADSYRVSRAPCTVPECLIPASTLADLEPGEITVTDRSVTFTTEGARRTVRTIEGDFPSTDRLTWDGGPDHLRADRAALLAAMKVAQLASPVGEQRQRSVVLMPDGDTLAVSSLSGEAESTARVEAECSFKYRVGMNAGFFVDLLHAGDEATVELSLIDALKPVKMAGAHGSEHLLMPFRLLT